MGEAILTLLTFVLFAILFERARLGSIVGLLVAGVVIGPYGLGIVTQVYMIDVLAELGVTFLLFNIGLELKIGRLRLYGAAMYALAVLQFAITAAVIGLLAKRLGLEPRAAIVVGLALALSSTALVLQVLADLGRTITQLGRMAIAILLIQDIAVGPVLIAVDSLGPVAGDPLAVLKTLGRVVVTVAAIILIGHYALPLLLRQVTKFGTQEAFLAVVLAVVLGAGWAMEHVGSSAAIGAFLAGLIVAETEYRHQIAADIAPFRGLLLGIFFIAVGIKANLPLIVDNAGLILALAAALAVTKAVTLYLLARLFSHAKRLSLELGVLLSQGSEFAFVIIGLAAAKSVLPASTADLAVAAVGISLVFVPLLASVARPILDRLEGEATASPARISQDLHEPHDHVIVAGFGQVGMALTRHLISLDIPVVVIDYDSQRVRASRERGLPVYYGNALRVEVLRSCRLEDARMIVIAVPDHDVSSRILELVHRLFPDVRVLMRAHTEEAADEFLAAGANAVVLDSLTTALDLAERVVLMYEPADDPDREETAGEDAAHEAAPGNTKAKAGIRRL